MMCRCEEDVRMCGYADVRMILIVQIGLIFLNVAKDLPN